MTTIFMPLKKLSPPTRADLLLAALPDRFGRFGEARAETPDNFEALAA